MVAYKVDFKPNDSLDFYDMLLSIYSLTVLKDPLKTKERIILRYYLLYGYSKETKDMIVLDMGIKRSNLNTSNYDLQKRGFLKPHPTNQRSKLISKELLELKDTFTNKESDKKLFILNIV